VSMLHKIEGGYLQLLRVLVLILATVALIGAVVLGGNAFSDYSAKPKAVSEAISIDPNSFRIKKEPETSSTEAADTAAPTSTDDSKLSDDLVAVINKHGKQLVGPSFVVQAEAVHTFVDAALAVPELGKDFISAQTKYLDQVFARPDVGNHVKGSQDTFFETMNDSFSEFRKSYLAEKQRIAAEKETAQQEVDLKKAGAFQALALFGGLLGAFVLLVLLIVLIRIERSIRAISSTHAAA
jgi:hypothetical protein